MICIGMNTEGIYRISGHAQDTLSIKEKFNKGINEHVFLQITFTQNNQSLHCYIDGLNRHTCLKLVNCLDLHPLPLVQIFDMIGPFMLY